jgi:hypothetical protein
MPKRKILYLIGLDRSGSTITGAMLGNHKSIACFGELQYHAKAVLANRMINDGQPINEISFWQTINKKLTIEFGNDIFQEYHKWKNKYERWRNLPILLLHFFTRNQNLKQYWKYNLMLVGALLDKDSKTTLCDSSKNVVRRFALGLSASYDLKTIFIIRDVRGYYWSTKKRLLKEKKPIPILSISLKWIANNILFAIISFCGNFLTIRYEALYNFPDLNFLRMSKKIKLDLMGLAEIVKEKRGIKSDNIIAGSHTVRNHKDLIIEIDESWKKHLSSKEKNVILMWSRWLLLMFGFSKN